MSAIARPAAVPELAFHPLTEARWDDLEALFGPNGACAGCWCMWWKQTRSEHDRLRGEGNRAALRALVRAGHVPGVLGYADGRPVAWCAVEPRSAYPTLQRSPVLKPLDGTPVWSITCLFIHRRWRRRGLSRPLLEAALALAADGGARIVEAYPVDTPRALGSAERFTGPLSTFLALGFREVARRSPTRPILRREVG